VVVSADRAKDAGTSAPAFTRATVEQTEKSLVKALMPERSFSCFAIPLMRIVKNIDEERCVRLLAAIALHELHSAVGDYAIAREATFADCPKMKHLCKWLTYHQALEDRPELAAK
jgi:hypothetical protein